MKNLIEREKNLQKKLEMYLKDDSTSGIFKSGRNDILSDDIRIVKPIDHPLRLEEEPTEQRAPATSSEIAISDNYLKWDSLSNVDCEGGSFAGYNAYFDEQQRCNSYIWLFDAAKWYRFDEYDCYLVLHELRYLFPKNAVDVNLTYNFRIVGYTSLFMGAETGEFFLCALPIEAPDFNSIVDPERFSIDHFSMSENIENIVTRGSESSNWVYGRKYFSGSFEVEKGVQSGMVVIVPIVLVALDGYVLAYNGAFFVDIGEYPDTTGIAIYLEEI